MVDFLIELAADITGGILEENLSRRSFFRRISPVTRFFLGLGAAVLMGLVCYGIVTFFMQ